MAAVSYSFDAPQSVIDALQLLSGVVIAIKTGGIAAAAAELPALMKVLGEISAIPGDIKSDFKDCEKVAACEAINLLNALLAPAPAAPAKPA